MRRNQVTIKIERFGDQAPENANGHQIISVYADANNVYEALAAAYAETIAAIEEDFALPSMGDRSHSAKPA